MFQNGANIKGVRMNRANPHYRCCTHGCGHYQYHTMWNNILSALVVKRSTKCLSTSFRLNFDYWIEVPEVTR